MPGLLTAACGATTGSAAPSTGTAPSAAATSSSGPAPSDSGSAPSAAGVTTIKVVDWVPENISSWANRWYKPFEEANPDIKIVHEQISQNYIETVLTRLTGANDIDLIFAAPDNVGSFLRAGAALDLTPLIEKDKDKIQLSDFPKWTLDDYTTVRYPELKTGPGQYGLPVVEFVWEMWENTDMLKAAGYTTPQRGWTWDDFASMSKKLTDASKKQYGYHNANWLLPLWTWLWQNNGKVLSDDGKQLTFASPEGIEAFQFLQDLQIKDKAFLPIDQTLPGAPNAIGFDTGNAAMITRGNWNLDLSRDWKFKWDLSYPPTGKTEATLGEELGLMINKNSSKQDAAWRVVSWVTSPEGQRALASNDVVPNTKVMAETGLAAAPDNVRNLVVPLSADTMVQSFPQWFRPKFTANDLADRLLVLWTGEAKVSELLPKVQDEFNKALAQPLP
ncbi:MAG: sugar ABC transporter substrate-binding protein [Chloroflexi bacterium]|nr:sugar ABC transporter substrate-binding protein [Chloroflexota bacterium]